MTLKAAQSSLIARLQTLYDARESANIADWVMEYTTGKKRIDGLLVKDEPLTQEQETDLQRITGALLQHTPVQYVLGESWFCGMKFFVNPHVLIPRPETEELVSWIREDGNKGNLLDIGTGSGCIAISLARLLPGTAITAIDVSEEALQVARSNADALQAGVAFQRLDFLQDSQWDHLPVFDTIVSNPPYIRLSESGEMNRNVLEHEPHIALFVPDTDALLFYRKIHAFSKMHLAERGHIFLEINEPLGPETVALFNSPGYTTELRKDMQGKYRMLKVSKTNTRK
jgi:release factor glutamine methyltransferase